MIPRAKKNLHEMAFHLQTMTAATHFEDFEIGLAAFANSGRNVTFTLQKEFTHHAQFSKQFADWYGKDGPQKPGTKRELMRTDPLCKFFIDLRNNIVKEGINGLDCGLTINSFDTGTDLIDPVPLDAAMAITESGIYYLIGVGTGKEDLIPARTRAELTTHVAISKPVPPTVHLGQQLVKNDVLSLCQTFMAFLTDLVEEWTAIIHKSS